MIAMERCRAAAARAGRVLGAAAAAQLAASAAWAAEAEGAGHGDPWLALLWKAVNFAVLVGLIWYFGRKPIAGMARRAARASQAALSERREHTRQAEAELAEQRHRIESLQAELERLQGEARDEARVEHDRLLAEARAQGERIKVTARQQVEQEFAKASKELQAELASQTIRLAEQMIAKGLDDAARQRIVTRAIDELGATS